MTQLQDLQSKYDALERQHEDGKKLFHQQRQTLLQDIKNKDQLLAEKEDQIQAQWASKVQALEDQLVQEKRDHDQDVLEWQQRYDQSMELEQRKSSRRLIEFHERLEAKSCCQQCGNKFRLQSHSAPSSPARRPSSLASSSPSLTSALSTSSPDTHSRRRYSLQSVEEVQTTFKLELLTREIQDSALRHQAHIDNLVAEHDQNIQDLKDQHQQALQLYHIQHECQLDEKDHQLRHNLAQAKTSLNLSHSKAITKLNKRVNWLKCELDLVQEEQASALQLAKSLNKQLDPALDLDDMKYTLVSLLQKAISGVSKSDALHYIKNCQQEEEQPSSWYC
ncbi:hypothetical protein DM01DRAFT_1170185 [Hesseltinella vesiculosa]|uniref:Uncharacterized protein n=1 Tax=Hesseltinella vesiculosa TaxID=101127 RepID=A0A1X2G5P6_9FUNG|nr:hypothetical protein DM01DRAFT_1170185 [Hesseltinella vesiculosa]